MFQGRFGRLFRRLHPATFGRTDAETLANLTALGAKMSAGFDPPTDGPDEEESGNPALYTYLARFTRPAGDIAREVARLEQDHGAR